MRAESVALITGGEGSLGTAIRLALETAGWNVHAPGRSIMDVTSPESVRRYVRGLTRLDLLVTTAGIRRDAPFVTQNEEDRNAVLNVCLRGAFLCAREAARLMSKHRSGHIVFIGSHSALLGTTGQTAYAAAKAGLGGLTRSLAAELGLTGLRVNCILPGWMDTSFTQSVPREARKRALESEALGVFSSPADTASFILSLHQLTAVSGQVFHLDSRITKGQG